MKAHEYWMNIRHWFHWQITLLSQEPCVDWRQINVLAIAKSAWFFVTAAAHAVIFQEAPETKCCIWRHQAKNKKKTDNLKDVMASCDECDEASQQRDGIIITYIRWYNTVGFRCFSITVFESQSACPQRLHSRRTPRRRPPKSDDKFTNQHRWTEQITWIF